MPVTKRTAEGTISSTHPSKTSKRSGPINGNDESEGAKKGAVPISIFDRTALPLHINITHTPPSLPEEDNEPVVPDDIGFIGTLTLVPSTFSTGSYGWKGNKKITVELLGSEEEETPKVEVMLSVNAVVVGSKNAAERSSEDSSEVEGGVGGYESDNDDEAE